MNLLCIDPGTESSGMVVFDGENVLEVYSSISNESIIKAIYAPVVDHMAIEMIDCLGMPVGRETFETCVWIGRFIQAFPGDYTKIYRRQVKISLCGSMQAKDKNIRQAVLDRFPATGGGKTPQIGIKSQPGPLYGVSSHAWSALAIGITWFDQQKEAA